MPIDAISGFKNKIFPHPASADIDLSAKLSLRIKSCCSYDLSEPMKALNRDTGVVRIVKVGRHLARMSEDSKKTPLRGFAGRE